MSDGYTESSTVSWGSRIKDSFKGILFGLILFIASFALLWWNEGRAVQVAKGLTEGAAAVVSISAERIDSSNDGKLVHLSGRLSTSDTVRDDVFGITFPKALKIKRVVEMYQWQEEQNTRTEKKLGGKEERITTYSYKKTWSPRVISSSNFKKSTGHQNPGSMKYPSKTFEVEEVSLDAFILSSGLKSSLTDFQDLRVTAMDKQRLPANIRQTTKLHGGGFYDGRSSLSPQVGDVRINFKVVKPQTVSVVAQQNGKTFSPYLTKQKTNIEMLTLGTTPAAQMFESAQSANQTMTWILRAVGFFMMFFGLAMIFKPFEVLASVVPFMGSLAGAGISIVSFLVALALSLVTIAIAWIVYRPLIGIGLLVVSVGAMVLVFIKFSKGKKKMNDQAPVAAG